MSFSTFFRVSVIFSSLLAAGSAAAQRHRWDEPANRPRGYWRNPEWQDYSHNGDWRGPDSSHRYGNRGFPGGPYRGSWRGGGSESWDSSFDWFPGTVMPTPPWTVPDSRFERSWYRRWNG
jgi:hypothetical protein